MKKPRKHTLYGSRGSGSAAIEIALERCGVPYRIVRASSWEPDSAIDQLAKRNPLRQVPTLVLPGGTVLSESAAILIHLGLAHPRSGLLPRDAAARAKAIRGLVFIAANCYAALGVNDHPERWTIAKTKAAREQVRLGGRRRLHRNWEIFADTFDARPYLGGKSPGALDILAAVVSKWAGTRAHLAESRPRFFETIARIEAHESVAPVFQSHWG